LLTLLYTFHKLPVFSDNSATSSTGLLYCSGLGLFLCSSLCGTLENGCTRVGRHFEQGCMSSSHTHMLTNSLSHTNTLINSHTHSSTHTHSLTHSFSLSHTHTHTHTHSSSSSLTHMLTLTHQLTHTLILSHTHSLIN